MTSRPSSRCRCSSRWWRCWRRICRRDGRRVSPRRTLYGLSRVGLLADPGSTGRSTLLKQLFQSLFHRTLSFQIRRPFHLDPLPREQTALPYSSRICVRLVAADLFRNRVPRRIKNERMRKAPGYRSIHPLRHPADDTLKIVVPLMHRLMKDRFQSLRSAGAGIETADDDQPTIRRITAGPIGIGAYLDGAALGGPRLIPRFRQESRDRFAVLANHRLQIAD